MKPSPGKTFLWLILSITTLFAQLPYEWSVTASKSNVVIDEAVVLHYTCRFGDDGSLYTIEFKPPKKRDGYRLYLLNENEKVRDGIRTNEFHFLYFPMQSGKQQIAFSAMMRRTTKDSIENAVIGRDNVEVIDFSDTSVELPVVELAVSPVESELVGEFTLDVHLNKESVRAFEPIQLSVNVVGEGNFDAFTPFSIDIPGVEVFAEKVEKKYLLSERGFKGRWTQRFALVAEQEFTLDAFKLDYYDLKERRVKQLDNSTKTIAVEKVHEVEELLDSEDEEDLTAWKWDLSHLNYLLTFLTGWVLGRWFRKKPLERAYDETLVGKIKNSRSVKALAMVLVLSGDKRFAPLISRLERKMDGKDLVKAKREALDFVDAEQEWDVPKTHEGLIGRLFQIFTQFFRALMGIIRLFVGVFRKR